MNQYGNREPEHQCQPFWGSQLTTAATEDTDGGGERTHHCRIQGMNLFAPKQARPQPAAAAPESHAASRDQHAETDVDSRLRRAGRLGAVPEEPQRAGQESARLATPACQRQPASAYVSNASFWNIFATRDKDGTRSLIQHDISTLDAHLICLYLSYLLCTVAPEPSGPQQSRRCRKWPRQPSRSPGAALSALVRREDCSGC